ncbi:unnamed protein product [Tilletia controversa]|nr:unnamed protein product [Tilletia controversa]
MAVSTKPKTKVASSAASNPLGKPSTPSQPSRKTKSSWRKNIHLPALIDTPPSTLPPPSHTLTNAQLYTEDRSADRVGANVVLGLVPQRKRKGAGLKSLEVLKNRSDVPAIPGRPRPSRNGGVSKEVKDQLRRIAHRDAEMVGSGTTGVKEAVVEAEFNIWEGNGGREEAGDGEAEGEGVEEEWIEDPRRVQAKLPRTMTSTPHPTDPIHLARTLTPALPIPHPGTSYNPTAADHAELLRLAVHELSALRKRPQQPPQPNKPESTKRSCTPCPPSGAARTRPTKPGSKRLLRCVSNAKSASGPTGSRVSGSGGIGWARFGVGWRCSWRRTWRRA